MADPLSPPDGWDTITWGTNILPDTTMTLNGTAAIKFMPSVLSTFTSSDFIPLANVRNARYTARLVFYVDASYNAGSSVIQAFFQGYNADRSAAVGSQVTLMPDGFINAFDSTNEANVWTAGAGMMAGGTGAVWGRFTIVHAASFTPNMWIAAAEIRRVPAQLTANVTNQSVAKSAGAVTYADIAWTLADANEGALVSSGTRLRMYEAGFYTCVAKLKATSSVAGGTIINVRFADVTGALYSASFSPDLFDNTVTYVYPYSNALIANYGLKVQVAHDCTAAVTFSGTVQALLSHN